MACPGGGCRRLPAHVRAGSVATRVLNEHSWTAEKRWCSRSVLCEGLANLYPQRKMLHITQGLADQTDEEEMGEARGT
jgi:hypothetical protein